MHYLDADKAMKLVGKNVEVRPCNPTESGPLIGAVTLAGAGQITVRYDSVRFRTSISWSLRYNPRVRRWFRSFGEGEKLEYPNWHELQKTPYRVLPYDGLVFKKRRRSKKSVA